MQGGLGLHARSPQDVVFLAFVPTAKASGNAPAHYSRPTQKQLRNWDSLMDALAIFRDVHLQSYACRLRESRGKPQDVVVCHKRRPKTGGGIEEELTNPPGPDRISTAGFSRPFGRGVENACKEGEGDARSPLRGKRGDPKVGRSFRAAWPSRRPS